MDQGSDTFTLLRTEGDADTVTDLQPGIGKLELRGAGNTVDLAVLNAGVVDGTTILTLGLSHTVTLTGVIVVDANWFG